MWPGTLCSLIYKGSSNVEVKHITASLDMDLYISLVPYVYLLTYLQSLQSNVASYPIFTYLSTKAVAM